MAYDTNNNGSSSDGAGVFPLPRSKRLGPNGEPLPWDEALDGPWLSGPADPNNLTTQPMPPRSGVPNFDQVNQDYQKYLGRPVGQSEFDSFWANKSDYDPLTDIVPTEEGKAFAKKPLEAPPVIPPVTKPLAGVIPGWDSTKWANQDHQTTKYVVGRILANYPPTVDGLKQAFIEIQKKFPTATFNGKDTISGLPGTQGPVDVLEGASQGGRAWYWGDTGVAKPTGPSGPTGPNSGPGPTGGPPLFTPPIFKLPPPVKTYGPSLANAGDFWEGRSPMDFSKAGNEVVPTEGTRQSQELLKQLLARIKINPTGIGFNRG